MKNFKLLAASLMVALCVLITSCSKDENELDSSKSEKRISKMTVSGFNVKLGVVDMFGIYTFNYANGKLVKIKGMGVEDTVEMNITYSGKQVTYSANLSDHESEEGVFQLNNEGFVESGLYTYTNTYTLDSTYTSTNRAQSTFEYSNGYLTKITLKKNYNTSSESVDIREIYYDDNGNISRTRTIWGGTTTSSTLFTVSNYQCKGKTFLFAIGGIGIGGGFALYYCGLLGKEPKNLISNSTDSYLQDLNYTFDKYGYINTMILKSGNREETWTYSYE